MKPEMELVPRHYQECRSCPYALAAKNAALAIQPLPDEYRSEAEVICVPPNVQNNSTTAIVMASVTHVLPFPTGTKTDSPYTHTVQCPVAVERLLRGKK